MYLDSRFNKNPKTRMTYVKNMLMVGVLVSFLFYVTGARAPQLGSGGIVSTTVVPGIGEEILTGFPNF